jgi:3-deoxy-manno-octulosonate cytidylyltransferase (CMP-KDO synthetase)
MSSTVIIIPSRLQAQRLPDKPLKLINQKEMILHVYDLAIRSSIGEVLVVTPDKAIFELVENYGGKSFLSKDFHETGTDRVFEGFNKFFSNKPEFIINLQGDMPNLNTKDIIKLKDYLNKKKCDIATLASTLESQLEVNDKNIVKVITKESIENSDFFEAIDFKREDAAKESKYIYHHIGIYGFTKEALIRYVNLKRSKLEIERKLEQMRALENKMKIHVGFTKTKPLSVDTQKDLIKIKKIMEK